MESKSKVQYREFCKNNTLIPVFAQPWYLDITCKKEWDVVLAFEKDMISGAWPLQITRKYGFKAIIMPPFTPALGPILNLPTHVNQGYKESSFYFKTIRQLEAQLPKVAYINLKWFPDSQSWFPLYELKYTQTTRYTYVIPSDTSIEDAKKGMKKQLRNVVCKEVHEERIQPWSDTAAFLEMVSKTFDSNGISKFFDREVMSEIIEKARERNHGEIWSYVNDSDQVIGAIFILEDGQKSYLLFTSANAEGKEKEAVGCLIWHALKHSLSRGLSFDFEGSMLPGVERFFRGFGGEQVPFHLITKINHPLLRLAQIVLR